ncbi:MAG TPA: hypothetical protein VGG99_10575 [Acetobacteraceae bacterium]
MAQVPTGAARNNPQPQILFSETPQDFGQTPARGQWNNIGGVNVLRSATNIPREAAAARRIFGADKASETDSLPDVWSQVEGFADALFQENHERHAAAVRVWRGLLACLALAGDTLPNLYVRKIDLTAAKPFMRTASTLPLRLPFLSFMYNERTNAPVALDEVGTLHLHRDRPPLAILEPISFVAPSRSMFEALAATGMDDRATWLTPRGIEDPTIHKPTEDWLSRGHYEILARYIQRLFVFVAGSTAVTAVGGQNIASMRGVAERLSAAGSVAPEAAKARVTALSGLLRDYWQNARDAAQRKGELLADQAIVYAFEPAPRHTVTPFADPLYGALRLQDFEVAKQTDATIVHSHTQIETRREAAGLFDAAVLADPQIALGDPQYVAVLDTATVMHLQKQSDLALNLQRNSHSRNILVVTPDDLLTDTLVQISNGTVPGHARRGFTADTEPLEQYVLPLTPLALLLLDNLAGDHPRLRLVRQSPGEVQAILTVPLKPVNGQVNRSHEVKKTYQSSGARGAIGMLTNATQAETLALWPNLEDRDWNAFHIYSVVAVQSVATDRTVLPLWPIQGHALAKMMGASDGGAATPAARVLTSLKSWTQIRVADESLPATRQIVMDSIGQEDGGRVQDLRLLQIATRPEAYIVAAPRPGELHNRSIEEMSPAGIVLVPPAPVNRSAQGEVLEIALDFGSTNTTLYMKGARDAAPQRVTFAARRLDILRTGGEPARQHEFAPIDTRPAPVSTVLERRPRILSDLAAAEEVGGGRAFVSDMRQVGDSILLASSGGNNYDFNIKWLPAQLGLSRLFLRHIALLVLAEAAARSVNVADPACVNWSISYPSAYSGNHYRQFINGIRWVLGYFLPSQIRPLVRPETESVCAARYFRARGQGAEGGTTIVLDIGGGTSDIAVWQHQSETNAPLIWQSSVRFAGQQLVVEPIARNLVPAGNQPGGGSIGPSILGVLAGKPGRAQTQADFSTAVATLGTHAADYARDGNARWAEWLNLVGIAINSEHFAATISGAFADLGVSPRNARVFDVVALGFAGLLWFVGRQLHGMAPPADGGTKEAETPASRLDPNLAGHVAVCLAGRPSRLLRDMIENRQGYEEAFARVLREAAGFGPEVRVVIHYTDHPKEEVAFGLLTQNLWSDTDGNPVGTILGEAVAGAGGSVIPANHVLPRNSQRLRIHNSAPEMRAFLRCVTGIVTDPSNGMRFIDLPRIEAALPDLVNSANGALMAAAGPAAAVGRIDADAIDDAAVAGPAPLTMEVQPPFFALLHQLMRAVQEKVG